MDIDSSLLQAPVVDRGGYPYLIHPLTDGVPRCPPSLLEEFAAWAAALPCMEGATVLLAPEAMGVPLAAAVSMKTGIPYLVVRKRQYDLPGEVLAYCETGYGESCLYINGLEDGDHIVIVDDVISTGGTLSALVDTLKNEGHHIQGVASFIDKGDKATALEEQSGISIDVMRTIDVSHGEVTIRT